MQTVITPESAGTLCSYERSVLSGKLGSMMLPSFFDFSRQSSCFS